MVAEQEPRDEILLGHSLYLGRGGELTATPVVEFTAPQMLCTSSLLANGEKCVQGQSGRCRAYNVEAVGVRVVIGPLTILFDLRASEGDEDV